MTDDYDEDTVEVADRLRARPPALRPTRRQELRARLLRMPQIPGRPAHLWLLVLAFAVSGLALLAIAAMEI